MAVSGSGAQTPAPPAPAGRRLRGALGCLAVAAVLVLLRLPPLFEPAWSSDAGAYANIGRSLDLGGVLYSGIWDNKPPGLYWLSALITAGGASALRMQLALSAIVALETLLVFLVTRRLASHGIALLAALIFAVVASVPNFSGDQFNAEIAGALPVLGAMLLLLRRTPIGRGHALGAGAMLGAALLFKATFAADVLAGLAVPILTAMAQRRRPSRAHLAPTLLVAAGVLLLCAPPPPPLAVPRSLSRPVDLLVPKDPPPPSPAAPGRPCPPAPPAPSSRGRPRAAPCGPAMTAAPPSCSPAASPPTTTAATSPARSTRPTGRSPACWTPTAAPASASSS